VCFACHCRGPLAYPSPQLTLKRAPSLKAPLPMLARATCAWPSPWSTTLETWSRRIACPSRHRPRELNPQISHKPRRRQRKTVAGWTSTRLRCQSAHHRDRTTHNNRSPGANMDAVWPFALAPRLDREGQSIPTQGQCACETAPAGADPLKDPAYHEPQTTPEGSLIKSPGVLRRMRFCQSSRLEAVVQYADEQEADCNHSAIMF
jgi:hypothetical protein